MRREAKTNPDFVKLKADKSLVTKADFASEELIREWIANRFPEDSIRGEEQSGRKGDDNIWIVDPIDGTYNFTYFGDKFGISVGLVKNNSPKLGAILYPAEDVSLSAAEGEGVWLNGKRLENGRGRRNLEEAVVAIELHPNPEKEPFISSTRRLAALAGSIAHPDTVSSRCFTYSFLKLVRGEADAILHFGATPYDIGAMAAIAKEMNMEISGLSGEAIDFSKDVIPVIISDNPELHRQIIERLNQQQEHQ